MRSARSLSFASLAAALAFGFACASTQTSDREILVHGKIPRPDHILVYDFAASAADVPDESAFAAHADAQQAASDADLSQARALGAELADSLAEEIRNLGLPAEHVSAGAIPQLRDIVIRGYFVSIEKGSAAERMVIGFGAGAAELKTVVEGFQMTQEGLRKLGSGSVSSGGAKGPGAALPAAVAIATANPIGLIVTSAVKAEGEMSGRSTIEGRARQTAKQIAANLEPRFREQGWIP